MALSRIRRSPQAGKALAIWGIALGAGWLVLLLFAIGLGAAVGLGFYVGTSGPKVQGSQQVPVNSLVTGDCFDWPTSIPSSGVALVEQTPCNQPHNSQIVAAFQASGSSSKYPGVASLSAAANRDCLARARGSVDGTKVTASMSGRFIYPLADPWRAGHRTISCVIYSRSSISSSVLKR